MLTPPDYILPEMQATERYRAIRELLQFLIQKNAFPGEAEDTLFSAFREREQIMSTGIGFELAFSHITSDLISKQITVLGRSSVGVDFSSIDGKPVKEIYLSIFPVSREVSQKNA